MKEKTQQNLLFIRRHQELAADMKTLREMAEVICGEFKISNHTYRAWKSRLYLQYGGKYKSDIQPYMKNGSSEVRAADMTSPVPVEVGV